MLTEPTPEAFAKGLQKVLEDDTLAKRLGENAVKEVNARFSNEIFDKKTQEMYEYMTQ